MMRLRTFALLVILAMLGSTARAQRADDARAGVTAPRPTRQLAPLASVIIPGSGQLIQGRNRALIYFAVEAVGWWKLARDVQDRADQTADYKDLARRVARANFSPNGPDGPWQYYEAMRDFPESGEYSTVDESVGFVPETRPDTYNGDKWVRARATTETYDEALALYKQLAYKQDMLWSWRNAGIHYNAFIRSTEAKNAANSAVDFDMAVLVLNHLISMIDSYSVFRLETHRMPDGRSAIGGRLSW